MKNEKPIYWLGTSYKDLLEFPLIAKKDAGYQLHRIQNGLDPESWKSFQTIGAGVREIRINGEGNIYRVMYLTKYADKIYILHSFQKKTQKTSPKDIHIANTRYIPIIIENADFVTFCYCLNYIVHLCSIGNNKKSLAEFPSITGIKQY